MGFDHLSDCALSGFCGFGKVDSRPTTGCKSEDEDCAWLVVVGLVWRNLPNTGILERRLPSGLSIAACMVLVKCRGLEWMVAT